jgi:hypothetical protein
MKAMIDSMMADIRRREDQLFYSHYARSHPDTIRVSIDHDLMDSIRVAFGTSAERRQVRRERIERGFRELMAKHGTSPEDGGCLILSEDLFLGDLLFRRPGDRVSELLPPWAWIWAWGKLQEGVGAFVVKPSSGAGVRQVSEPVTQGGPTYGRPGDR